MRTKLILIILIFPFWGICQNSKPWVLGCDSSSIGITALENCLEESLKIADSMILENVKSIEFEIAQLIKRESDEAYQKILEKEKKLVIESHIRFQEYRNSIVEIIGYEFLNTEICNITKYRYAIELTTNQISIYESILFDLTSR